MESSPHVPDLRSYEPLVLHREARFDVVVLQNQRPRVVVKAAWDPEIAAYMATHALTDLSLNTGMGWTGGGIEFLASAPPLRSLAVLDWHTHDLTPLRRHADTLDELIVECNPRRILSLGELPALKRFAVKWERGWEGVFDASEHGLRRLAVQGWPYEDLRVLERLPRLEEMSIVHSRKLRDIAGVRGRDTLTSLSLTQCNSVTEFDVVGTCTALVKLELECSMVRDIGFAANLQRLEFLFIGKHDIPTLAPLERCTRLRRFSTEGKVLDGDLSLFLRLPAFEWAGIGRGKGYRPPVTEINAKCRHRWRP